jgi:hypothetical protein
MLLLTEAAASPKLAHEIDIDTDYASAVLYLAPHKFAGRGNVCAGATEACIAGCLGLYAGRADIVKAGEKTNAVREARIRRTEWFFDDLDSFLSALRLDIAAHVKKCAKNGKRPAIRLNGSSDIPWERVAPELFAEFANVTFYDYSKLAPSKRAALPENYTLTHSFSGENYADMWAALSMGRNVAVVFRVKPSQSLPDFVSDADPSHAFASLPVIDGDTHDQRFLDPKGVIVGLRAKGKLRKQVSAFVVG